MVEILCKTVIKVFKRSDINREGTVSDLDFGDWLLKENRISEEEFNSQTKTAMELLNKCKK